jgi:hypothetical protein
MSCKDGSANQTEAYCDRFNHLDAPCYTTGTSDSRSWFQAGFFGAGKWFRLTPPAVGRSIPLSDIPDDDRYRWPVVAGDQGGPFRPWDKSGVDGQYQQKSM